MKASNPAAASQGGRPSREYSQEEHEQAMYLPSLYNQQESLLEEFFDMVGIYSGISFVRLAFYNPIQRMTVILNTESELVRQGILNAPFGGVVPAVRHLILTEGFFGAAFRATISDAVLTVPVRVVEKLAAGFVSSLLQQAFASNIENWSLLRLLTVLIAASSVAMVLCAPVSYPREAIITRMMCDVRAEPTTTDGGYRYTGPISAFKSFKSVGSLFSGALVGVANLIVYRSVFYYSLNGALAVLGQTPVVSKVSTIVCTFLASIAHHPLDVIRQRMIVSADGPKRHDSATTCAKHIVKKEGYSGLYRGLKFKLAVTAVNILFVELLNSLQS